MAGNPFIAPHLYVQWGGLLPGNETWSCGVRLSQVATGPWPATDAADNLAAVATAVQAMHSRGGSLISNKALLSFVKVNQIGTDGLYTAPTTNEQVIANVPGGNVGQPPNQIALVVTLNTAVSRGPAHQGRFYLPLPVAPVQDDGLIQASDAASVKASMTTFITALNAVSPKYKVGIYSRKAGAPAQRLVTAPSVGRVLDTQRRRRRSLAETYV